MMQIDLRAAKIVATMSHFEVLKNCTVLRKEPEVKALRSLERILEDELKAKDVHEKLQEQIEQREKAKVSLSQELKKSKAIKTGRNLAEESSSSSESESDWPFCRPAKKRSRADLAKARRREKSKEASQRKAKEQQLEEEIEQTSTQLSDMKARLSKTEPDLDFLVASDMCQVMCKSVKLCSRRAGVVEARKSFLHIFEMLEKTGDPAAQGLAALAADVSSIRKAKLAQAKPLNDDIADRFAGRSGDILQLGIGLGVVDDLVTIATGAKSNAAVVKILAAYKDLDSKAKKFEDDLEAKKSEVEGDLDGIIGGFDVEALALQRLRRMPTNRKRMHDPDL